MQQLILLLLLILTSANSFATTTNGFCSTFSDTSYQISCQSLLQKYNYSSSALEICQDFSADYPRIVCLNMVKNRSYSEQDLATISGTVSQRLSIIENLGVITSIMNLEASNDLKYSTCAEGLSAAYQAVCLDIVKQGFFHQRAIQLCSTISSSYSLMGCLRAIKNRTFDSQALDLCEKYRGRRIMWRCLDSAAKELEQ